MKTSSIYFSKKILAILIFTIAIPAITLAQWSAPVNISPAAVSAGLNESMGSCIGVSNDTLHVVWTDKLSGTTAALYYRRSTDIGVTWGNVISLTGINGNAYNPAIAVNGQNVHVAWREINPVGGHRASWYKHSLDGGNTWGPSVFLDSTADWPAITVSGNIIYIANDVITSQSPYNTEIFFLRSLDNGLTWGPRQQLTFAVGRSEDESIHAQGSHVHMSWNDNRTGLFQILYKESNDYGVTWGPDVVVNPIKDYNTMVWSNGANVDVISAGAPSGKYQLIIAQSADSGATWGPSVDVSNDTGHVYYLPSMVRDGNDLHVVVGSSAGPKYFHSGNGGTTWDPAATMSGVAFIAYTGCVLHIIYVDANKKINYLRNPTGNGGLTCQQSMGIDKATGKTNQMIAYPNPANNTITVTSETELGLITIYNAMGQVIYKEKTPNTQHQIDISKQVPGIYFLAAQNKFIKIIKE